MTYRKLKLPFLDSLEIMRSGETRQAYPTHVHETACISLVEQGSITENGFVAAAGSLLLTAPGEVHDNATGFDSPYRLTTFYVSPDLFMSRPGSICFTNKIITDPSLFGQLAYWADELLQPTILVDANHLQGIFSQLATRYLTDQPIFGESRALPAALLDIQATMRHRFAEKISVEAMGHSLGMSRFAFIRWFRQHTGLTPHDYLLVYRIEQAKTMLDAGKPTIQTALDVGFYDQSHFANAFKRYVGVTPKTYQLARTIFQD